MPQGTKFSPEKRSEILKELGNDRDRGAVLRIAKKHGVHHSTIAYWLKGQEQGPKDKPVVKPERQKKSRRVYTDDFKAAVVEDYIQRQAGTYAEDIGKKHGVTANMVMAWMRASREGKLVARPEPDRSSAPPAPKRPNGQISLMMALTESSTEPQHVHVQPTQPLHVQPTQPSLPPQLTLYVERLEAQNKALRKMLQIALEAI